MGRRVVTAVVVVGLLLGVWVRDAAAALRTITITYLVTSVDPGVTSIHVGDQFVVSYTLQDSTTDTNASVGAGTFPGMFTAFSVAPAGTNTGSWTPTGDTFNIAGGNYVTNAFGDNLTFQVRSTGSGFPGSGDGTPFFDVSLGYGWPTDLTDSGTGDTFAAQLGVPFDVPPATNQSAQIRFSVPASLAFENANMIILSGSGVPAMPPAGLVVLMIALLALAWMSAQRARRRATGA